MCTKNNLSFSLGSVFTLYIQIMCVYIIYNICVCVCLAYETSFVSKYLKPTPKTKAGRLPLRRHHEAAVEGNHSLASPPAAGNPWRIPWRNPGFPHGKNHPRLENRKRKSRFGPASNCSFRQYVKYLNSAQLRTKRDQAYSVTGKVTGNCGLKSRRTPKRTRAVSLGQVGEVAESDPSFRPLHVWKLVPTCHVHIDLYVIIHMSGCTRYDVSL